MVENDQSVNQGIPEPARFADAWIYPCSKDKAPIGKWKESDSPHRLRPTDTEAIARLLASGDGYVGLRPFSVGLFMVDVDKQGPALDGAALVMRLLGEPRYNVPTGKPGHAHLFYPAGPDIPATEERSWTIIPEGWEWRRREWEGVDQQCLVSLESPEVYPAKGDARPPGYAEGDTRYGGNAVLWAMVHKMEPDIAKAFAHYAHELGPDSVPTLTAARLELLLGSPKAPPKGRAKGKGRANAVGEVFPDSLDVDAMLWECPPTFPAYADWLAVSGSYKTAGGSFETWRAWCASGGWAETRAKWESLPTDRLGVGTFVHHWRDAISDAEAIPPHLPYTFTLESATEPCSRNATTQGNAFRYLAFPLETGQSLVVVTQQDDRMIPAKVYVRQPNGLLDRGAAQALPALVAREYYDACYVLHAERNPDFAECVRHARGLGESKYLPELLGQLPNAIGMLQEAGMLPAHVESVGPEALDANPRLWGYDNGIVDADTGRFAAPDVLKGSYVTATIPHDFNPDAHLADVDLILPPDGQGTDEQQTAARLLGHQLRNRPGKNFVAEICPANSGKTVRANLLARACWPYVQKTDASTFEKAYRAAGAHAYNNNLALVTWPCRILLVTEVSKVLDIDLLKIASGGEGSIDQRTIGETNRRIELAAILWFIGNVGTDAAFGVGSRDDNADALKSRANFIVREAIPEGDRQPHLLDLGLGDGPEAVYVRQAVSARLHEYMLAYGSLPFPDVGTDGLERAIDRETPEWRKEFLADCMVKGEPEGETPNSKSLYLALERWAKDNGIPWGELPKQRGFTDALNKHFGATPKRDNLGKGKGRGKADFYHGFRLAGPGMDYAGDSPFMADSEGQMVNASIPDSTTLDGILGLNR